MPRSQREEEAELVDALEGDSMRSTDMVSGGMNVKYLLVALQSRSKYI